MATAAAAGPARTLGARMRLFLRAKQERRRRMRDNALLVALAVAALLQLALATGMHAGQGGRLAGARKLLVSEESYYPKDQISDSAKRDGWVVLHAVFLVYTFVALAFVCDEFFVPALERIVETFNIPEDVAGATFMAAGGSAPELVTSFLGVFVSKSDVGFGTIIGSAVFNVLFVIGMCAIFSKDLLTLTWWPLFRDCTFYAVDLGILAWFFSNDGKIALHESIVLLLLYSCYVVFMYFNETVELRVKRNLFGMAKTFKDMRRHLTFTTHGEVARAMGHREDRDEPSHRTLNTKTRVHPDAAQMTTADKDDDSKVPPVLQEGPIKAPSFSVSVAHAQLRDAVDSKRAGGSASFTSGAGEARLSLSSDSTKALSRDLRFKRAVTMDVLMRREARCSVIIQRSMNEGHEGDDGEAGPRRKSVDGGRRTGDMDNAAEAHKEEEEAIEEEGEEEEEGEGEEEEEEEGGALDLTWPKDDLQAQMTYVLTAPIVFSVWLTVPDVRREDRANWFPLAFFGAISWIALISYPMVWMASTIGDTMGVSEEVMGITILAAGTSIPDLLSSVIVAQQGQGDMAVSSSIGSNIFDITLGLPLPWFFWCLINDKKYSVTATTLKFSLILLLFMLVAVVTTIAACGWKMTRALGGVMFSLYGIFIMLSLLKSFGHLGTFLD